jgi:hypothetical protein
MSIENACTSSELECILGVLARAFPKIQHKVKLYEEELDKRRKDYERSDGVISRFIEEHYYESTHDELWYERTLREVRLTARVTEESFTRFFDSIKIDFGSWLEDQLANVTAELHEDGLSATIPDRVVRYLHTIYDIDLYRVLFKDPSPTSIAMETLSSICSNALKSTRDMMATTARAEHGQRV